MTRRFTCFSVTLERIRVLAKDDVSSLGRDLLEFYLNYCDQLNPGKRLVSAVWRHDAWFLVWENPE